EAPRPAPGGARPAAARRRPAPARGALSRRARPDVPRRGARPLMRRIPWELLAVPALGIARLLPDSGGGLWLRLTAATACLLLPGALVARGLCVPGVSAALAWSLGALFAAMAVVFAVHATLTVALALLCVIAASALPWALFPSRNTVLQAPHGPPRARFRASDTVLQGILVAAAGIGFGIALWAITHHLTGGDDFFHLARVRKLDDFGGLS